MNKHKKQYDNLLIEFYKKNALGNVNAVEEISKVIDDMERNYPFVTDYLLNGDC